MTELLKDLMHERADEIERPVLDLDAITREGARRVRRRRGVGGALAAAAAVTVGIAGPQVVDLGGPDGSDGSDDTNVAVSESPALTWAEGSKIHSGGDTVDVGHEVHAFVTTPGGYYVTDADGTVWSWTSEGAKEAGSVGPESDGRRALVADESAVAWINREGQRTQLHIEDLTSGGLHAVDLDTTGGGDSDTEFGGPEVLAVSDGTVYYFDGRDTRAADIARQGDADQRVLIPGRADIADVEGGLILVTFQDQEGAEELTVVTRDLADRSRPLAVRGGDLSPSARYVMSENSDRESDHFTLLDVASGDDLTPPAAEDYDFFLGYAWVDDATYTAFGLDGVSEEGDSTKATVELLVCTVATRECTVGGRPGSLGDFQVPVGEHIGD